MAAGRVLTTGGGTGIGRAAALVFAERGAFLASDHAAYVTGAVHAVDGGMAAL